MPTEWHNDGDWDGLPVSQLGNVMADFVREARRRRSTALGGLSEDPEDYDGLPPSRLRADLGEVLNWLRGECDNATYPDFIEDVTYPNDVYAFVQGDDSEEVVTEEYLGIDGLDPSGLPVTGQVWHRVRRAIERLRWRMTATTQFGLEMDGISVKDNFYEWSIGPYGGTLSEIAALMNANVWPPSGSYSNGIFARQVSWQNGSFSNSGEASGPVFRTVADLGSLSYWDQIVRVGVAHRKNPLYPTLPFLADGEGPFDPASSTPEVEWLTSIPERLVMEAVMPEDSPVTFSAGPTSILRSGDPLIVTVLHAVVTVRDIELEG